MKQRLCLGRALIHNPKVLILDEPAAGLDPRARIELREMIGALASEGKSLLVSSHILTELAEMCDRVGIIEHGRLLAVGTVEEILNQRSPGESQTTKTKIEVALLGDVETARQWLESQSGVESAIATGQVIEIVVSGDLEFQADLLAGMISAGIRVVGYSSKQKSLEDVFLTVTRGRVQ